METKDKEKYNGSEGQAEVRASGRVAREAKGPVQAAGRSPLGQDIDQPRKEPSKKSQEGSFSSFTATSKAQEDEKGSIDLTEQKDNRSCIETPGNRTSREKGRVAERIRRLTRTHGRARRQRNTKTLAMRRKGCSSRGTRRKAAGKAPLSQETEKPQEGAPEEQQEGSGSSSKVPKKGEEGEQQRIDH